MVPKPGKPAFRYGHPADGRHVGEKGDVIVSLVSGNGSRELSLIFDKSDGSKVVSVSDQPPRLKTSELRARARDSLLFSSWTFSPRIQGLVLLNLVSLFTQHPPSRFEDY